MIAFSTVSDFQVRLPSGDNQTSLLNVAIYIRDILDCLTVVNMSSVSVITDSVVINDLINSIQSSSSSITSNPLVQLLSSGNQNTVGQVLTSVSQQFNTMNSANVDKAASSKYYPLVLTLQSDSWNLTEKSVNRISSRSTLSESDHTLVSCTY
jgi:hypothetical protein